jgi:hypothetical protein
MPDSATCRLFEPPAVDDRGGVTWRVSVGEEMFEVLVFLDSAYGADAPLFRLPTSGQRSAGALAVTATFDHWLEHRAEIDPVLSAAAARATPKNRHLVPSPYEPGAQPRVYTVPEVERRVVPIGPPQVTELESIRFPLLVDGVPAVGTISLHRPPGWNERVAHIGCEGTDDLAIANAGMHFMDGYLRDHRQEVDAMLAKSSELRLAAGIIERELDPPQPPPVRLDTTAEVRDVFRTTGGRIVFVVAHEGWEGIADADSYGDLVSSGSAEADAAALNFILDHSRELALMGLNVEAWGCAV